MRTFFPRSATTGRHLEPVMVQRELVLYGVPGFCLHFHVRVPELYTVSHIETGLAVAHGADPARALKAVRETIRRERKRQGTHSAKRIFAWGIARGKDRIQKLQEEAEL